MTQIKNMTDQQLNRSLAEITGWTNFREGGHGIVWGDPPDDRWTNTMPNYCNDPVASLEVQAKDIEVDAVGYVRNLSVTRWGERIAHMKVEEWTAVGIISVSELLTASPRERAEAAYITLSSVKE